MFLKALSREFLGNYCLRTKRLTLCSQALQEAISENCEFILNVSMTSSLKDIDIHTKRSAYQDFGSKFSALLSKTVHAAIFTTN